MLDEKLLELNERWMSLQAGPVEFYLLADNLLGYRNLAASHIQSFQFGLNILSWGRN